MATVQYDYPLPRALVPCLSQSFRLSLAHSCTFRVEFWIVRADFHYIP